jgi:hydrogenase 3 maturation protease
MRKQQLRPALKRALGPEPPSDARPVVVLGVGSQMRCDDAAGLHVAAAVSRAGLPGVHAWETGPAPENFTAEIRRLHPATVVIVDCAHMEEAPGTLRLIEPQEIGGVSFGTHGLPLSVLADYLLKEVGCSVLILGIQPASVEVGEAVSQPVQDAIGEAASLLLECLSRGRSWRHSAVAPGDIH